MTAASDPTAVAQVDVIVRMITIYDRTSGAVRYSATVEEGREDACCEEGEGWVLGAVDGSAWRVGPLFADGLLPLREMDLSVSGNTISGIPEGATAFWKLAKVAVDDGMLELVPSLGLPERVRVRITCPAFQLAEVSVDLS